MGTYLSSVENGCRQCLVLRILSLLLGFVFIFYFSVLLLFNLRRVKKSRNMSSSEENSLESDENEKSEKNSSDDSDSQKKNSKSKSITASESKTNESKMNDNKDTKRTDSKDIKPVNLDNVTCTACSKQMNPYITNAVKRHPVLKVLICKKCYQTYTSDEIEQDKEEWMKHVGGVV